MAAKRAIENMDVPVVIVEDATDSGSRIAAECAVSDLKDEPAAVKIPPPKAATLLLIVLFTTISDALPNMLMFAMPPPPPFPA